MSIEDFEAENALRVLEEARKIEEDPAMLGAIKRVAQAKLELAQELTESKMPSQTSHPDRTRDGRVTF